MQLGCRRNVTGSVVQGVWTNGCEIFSVGLDQLVRAWRITLSGSALRDDNMCVGGVTSSEKARAMEHEAHDQETGAAGEGACARDTLAGQECAGVTVGEGEDTGVTMAGEGVAVDTQGEREHVGVPVEEDVCGIDTAGDKRDAGVTRDTPGDARAAGVTRGTPGDGREAGVTRSCSAQDGFAIVQGPGLRVDETAQGRLQVLEPGAMTVFPGDGGFYTLAVVGRGTEILTYDYSKSV